MNLERGFKRIVLVLSVITALGSGVFALAESNSYFGRRAECAKALNAWWRKNEAAQDKIESLAREKIREREEELQHKWPRRRITGREMEEIRSQAEREIVGSPPGGWECVPFIEYARAREHERDPYGPLIMTAIITALATAIGGAVPWGLFYLVLWILRGFRN